MASKTMAIVCAIQPGRSHAGHRPPATPLPPSQASFQAQGWGRLQAAREFLDCAPEKLDAGVGVPLRDYVMEGRTRTQAIAFMVAPGTFQDNLDKTIRDWPCNSLPIERANHAIKRNRVAGRVDSVGRRSQNNILSQYRCELERSDRVFDSKKALVRGGS